MSGCVGMDPSALLCSGAYNVKMALSSIPTILPPLPLKKTKKKHKYCHSIINHKTLGTNKVNDLWTSHPI